MHIWYVHPYAGGPGLGTHYRPYHLARAWQRQGHSATIFVAGFHHLLQTRDALPANFEIEGVNYVTVPARAYSGNGVGRILNMAEFSSRLRQAGSKYGSDAPRPDAIIVSSPHPFSIFAGHALAKRYGAKLIFEIRDIWPLSLTEILGVSPWHPFVKLCGYAERFALDKADLITSVLPRADHYLAERGYAAKPFQWVPNGIDTHDREQDVQLSNASRLALEKISQWREDGCAVVVHAGSLGSPNAVDRLLKAFLIGRSRGEANKSRLLLIGRGEQMPALQQFAEEHNIDGVHFTGHVAKEDVPHILRSCDVGYAGVRSIDRLYRFGVSLNKFADYFGAGLPVLLPIAPCGDPVSESGGGIARAMDTAEAVWGALHELVRISQQERRALGDRGRVYMAQHYDYDGIASNYTAAIARLPEIG